MGEIAQFTPTFRPFLPYANKSSLLVSDWDDEETAIEGIRSNVQTSSVFDMSGRKAQQNTLRSGL